MNLFSRVKAHDDERKAIIREYKGVIDVRNSFVQIYDVESFFKYSNGMNVEIAERKSSDFNWQASFQVEGIQYLIVLDDEEKKELEKLINEREANEFIDSLGDL